MEFREHKRYVLKGMLFIAILFGLVFSENEKAGAASTVSIGTIDYDKLVLQVNYNSNSIVYFSTDDKTWTEVEGAYDVNTKSCMMDISWISMTRDTTLYFKGDVAKTVKRLTLPQQNTSFTVKYDKMEEEFNFENTEDANSFEWRKSSDYNWNTVSLHENSSSYQQFMKQVKIFHATGASLVFRIPQVPGTSLNKVGKRMSREVSVAITKRAKAPAIKINASKLNLNTSTSMEYYDPMSGLWIECSPSMSLDEIAPKVLYENGSIPTTLQIRKAATNSAPYSKTTYLSIPGQSAPPSIGGSTSEVTYYYLNSKLILQFNKASDTNLYEYVIVKPGYDFHPTRSWKTVKNTKIITLSKVSAPKGTTVYVRRKGINGNSSKEIDPVLSSAYNSFIVSY